MGRKTERKFPKFVQVVLRKCRTARIRFDAWKRNPSRLILKSVRGVDSPVFVQIGSNDGKSNDPFYPLLSSHPSWRALLVEPIPSLFERLKVNYADRPNTGFVNAAITDGPPGERVFYYLSDAAKVALPDLPPYYDQLGSFDRAHIFKHVGPEVEPFVLSSKFPTLSLPGLLEANEIEKVDVLHIDAEGYDWEILRQLDLQKYSPVAILFEHVHLSKEALEEARNKLGNAYRLYDLGDDFFCRKK
jgi:FkbM family methyltransferase